MTAYPHRSPWSKHRYNVFRDGFYARALTADDRIYLEQVVKHGVANSSILSTSVLSEEMEFWQQPYTIDYSVERRIGPVPMRGQGETLESKALRQAQWRARNAKREADKAMEQAELERERKAWEEKRRRTKIRRRKSDIEWEQAAPPWGTVSEKTGRHYIPQWKLDEERDYRQAVREERLAKKEEAVRKRLAEQAEQARMADERKAKERRERDAVKLVLAQGAAKEALVRAAVAQVRAAEPSLQPAPVDAEAHQWSAARRQAADLLKQRITTIISGTYPKVWTIQMLMHRTGCRDETLVVQCCEEMLREKQMYTAPVKVP